MKVIFKDDLKRLKNNKNFIYQIILIMIDNDFNKQIMDKFLRIIDDKEKFYELSNIISYLIDEDMLEKRSGLIALTDRAYKFLEKGSIKDVEIRKGFFIIITNKEEFKII